MTPPEQIQRIAELSQFELHDTDAPFQGVFGESPELHLLQEMLCAPDHEYTKIELASGAGIARTTLDRILPKFLAWGFVTETKRIGRIRLYKLNASHPVIVSMDRLTEQMSATIAEKEIGNDRAREN